ncbi:YkgJ family cysteine cluster protein [Desulfococcaceae bacterium OttesenSCG-928-F15]|nr:YkgJ family cysteine cluster protein [Desulfococcaceae bacterium OttesenSCG-928-F15]
MKHLDPAALEGHPGKRIHKGDRFSFACHDKVSCFNLCCRNLNLFLYPYDVLCLSRALRLSAPDFFEKHTDVILRENQFFPEVLLKMAENEERTCPFLGDSGCSVYAARPDACRSFPVELGAVFSPKGEMLEQVAFFRPPDFCMGQKEEKTWTLDAWIRDQEAENHVRMTREWAAVRALFDRDPWGLEGVYGKKGKMAFMAAYNMDDFRKFLFESSFFTRYKVSPELKVKLKKDDTRLLRFGFDWIRHSVWGMSVPGVKLK